MTRRFSTSCAVLFVATLASFSTTAAADARSDYLINMLENGATYRMRVQAATTLGVIRCTEAIPSLTKALEDESDLVVIAAANALGQIADPSSIPPLEAASKVAPSDAAKAQIETTLRVLRALGGEGDVEAPSDEAPRYLLRVDAMGDSSGSPRGDLPDEMKQMVVDRLDREASVVLQPPEMKGDQVKAKTKKEKLKAFILTGSILRLERQGAQLAVKISLNVFSNPGYNLLAMPAAEGSVAVGAQPLSEDAERAAENRALKAVIDALVGSVLKSLEGLETR